MLKPQLRPSPTEVLLRQLHRHLSPRRRINPVHLRCNRHASTRSPNEAPRWKTPTTSSRLKTSAPSSPPPRRSFSALRDLYSRLLARLIPLRANPRLRAVLTPIKYLILLFPILKVFETHVGQVVWINGASMYPCLNGRYYEDARTSQPVWVKRYGAAVDLERGMVVSFRSPLNPEHEAVKRVVALPGDLIMIRTPSHGTPIPQKLDKTQPQDDEKIQSLASPTAEPPQKKESITPSSLSPFDSRATSFPSSILDRAKLASMFSSSSSPSSQSSQQSDHEHQTTQPPSLQPIIIPYNHVWLEGDNPDPTKTLDSHTYGPVSMSCLTGRVTLILESRFAPTSPAKTTTKKQPLPNSPSQRERDWWEYILPFRLQSLGLQGVDWEGSKRTAVVEGFVEVKRPWSFTMGAAAA